MSIMNNKILISFFYVVCIGVLSSCLSNPTDDYNGKPYFYVMHHGGAQIIPGKLQCEYYDLGGEGIAYHDSDTINSGSQMNYDFINFKLVK